MAAGLSETGVMLPGSLTAEPTETPGQQHCDPAQLDQAFPIPSQQAFGLTPF